MALLKHITGTQQGCDQDYKGCDEILNRVLTIRKRGHLGGQIVIPQWLPVLFHPWEFPGSHWCIYFPVVCCSRLCSACGSSTGGWTVWRPNFGSRCGVVWWQTMEYSKPQPWDISKECREAQHAEEQHLGHQHCQEEEENPYEGRVLLVY